MFGLRNLLPLKRFITVLLCTFAAIALGWLALRKSGDPQPKSGHELARLYCQSCHLFPEPALLDKGSWTNGALPDMAKWVGLTPPDIERTPDGQIVPDSNVFPPTPLLTREEWDRIVGYYANAAPDRLPSPGERPAIATETKQFRAKDFPYRRRVPMTSMVHIDSVNRRLYVGDALTHTLEALDASGNRLFTVEFDSGPISILPGANSLEVTLVGRLFPSDLVRGKIVQLRPGADSMNMDRLIGNLRRPVHTAMADLNGDGRDDFLVSQFGNRKGRLSWFESRADAGFAEHVLMDRPGAIRTEVRDMNGDGRLDIVALFGQAWEGLYLFANEGGGRFAQSTILEQHPLFGFSYFELVDFDKDGDIDLLTTNGDNGESAAPPKPYHGIRIYLNDGRARFAERSFFPLHGTYGARCADFDLDGDNDIAAISYFPDFANAPQEAFIYLENAGDFKFRASTIPQHADGRWITMDAGDFDGDGDSDLVLGSLVLGPPSIPIPPAIQERWRSNAPAILLLENTQK